MRISRIVVQGLFGMFDHDIKLDVKHGVTILIGPNGVGKTTILRMISDVFRSDYRDLASVKFTSLKLYLEDGAGIRVNRTRLADAPKDTVELDFSLLGKGHDKAEPFHVAPGLVRKGGMPVSFLIDRYLPELRRIGPSEWQDRETGERFDWVEARERFADRLPPKLLPEKAPPTWLTSVLHGTQIYFIKAQRLIRDDDNRVGTDPSEGTGHPKYAVASCSEDLMLRMQKVSRDYALQSQNLDSTFPIRLLQAKVATTIPRIKKALEELQTQRAGLISVGMLDPTEDKLPKNLRIGDESIKALSLYVEDNQSKLDVMSGIANQLSLFLAVVNGRFEHKRLVVHYSRGMYVMTSASDEILPEQLSSGEQNELLLFYELIFQVPEGSLILVDEPEISLHPAWQRQFISDLLTVTAGGGLNAVVATHSPIIIGDRWDLVQQLGDTDVT